MLDGEEVLSRKSAELYDFGASSGDWEEGCAIFLFNLLAVSMT